jgi:hypothetical protein
MNLPTMKYAFLTFEARHPDGFNVNKASVVVVNLLLISWA